MSNVHYIPLSTGPLGEVQEYIYETYLNAGPPIGAIYVPWPDDPIGFAVDGDGDDIRVGIYHDWSTGDDEGVLRYCKTAAEAIAFIEHITEDQPEGVDWAAWASLRVAEWEGA